MDSPQKAEEMLRETHCDAVMIGRGARGNPWIFSRILAWRETGTDPGRPPARVVRDMILRHARMLAAEKGESAAVREMRSHVAWYTAGYPHSAALRREVNVTDTMERLEELLTKALP